MHKMLIVGGVIFASLLLFVGGKYHIVYGSTVNGPKLEAKPSFSLSETFVNLDSVGNMPLIAARAQYPMYVAGVERRIKDLTVGCGSVKVGMWRSEALERCGKPAHTTTISTQEEALHWKNGLMIRINGGRVISITE